MEIRAFSCTDWSRLPIGACFADPYFGDPQPAPVSPNGLGDFTRYFTLHGLFVKIHSDFAYRNGRTGEEEAVLRYRPTAKVLYSSCADFGCAGATRDLKAKIACLLMTIDPAGTTFRHLCEALRNEKPNTAELQAAIDSMSKTILKPQLKPKLIRKDGSLLRLTSDGVRIALSHGATYQPSLKFSNR